MKDIYIKATREVLETHTDFQKVFEGLRHALRARGHEKLYAGILRGVLRSFEHTRLPLSEARITIAHTDAMMTHSNSIEKFLKESGASAHTVLIDPTVIGGVAFEYNHHVIDQTYKRKLLNLYRAVTR